MAWTSACSAQMWYKTRTWHFAVSYLAPTLWALSKQSRLSAFFSPLIGGISQTSIISQSYNINNITAARLLGLVIAMWIPSDPSPAWVLLHCHLLVATEFSLVSPMQQRCKDSVSLHLEKLISDMKLSPRTRVKYAAFIYVIHLLQKQFRNKLHSTFLFIIHVSIAAKTSDLFK